MAHVREEAALGTRGSVGRLPRDRELQRERTMVHREQKQKRGQHTQCDHEHAHRGGRASARLIASDPCSIRVCEHVNLAALQRVDIQRLDPQ